MRLCFLADANHPNTLNWVEYLAQELGHDVHVVSLNVPSVPSRSVQFHHLHLGVRNKLRYFLGAGRLRKLLSDISPDLLVGYRLTSYAFAAASTGFHPLVVVAQSEKAAGRLRSVRKPVQWLAARYAVGHADLALAWAPHMARDIASLGGDERRIVTIPRGVDLRKFPFSPKPRSEELTLVTTRGLKKSYNLGVVLRAVALLRERWPEVRCLIVGEGREKPRLVALSRKLEIEAHVEFAGAARYEQIVDYLKRADVYVSPVPEDGVSSSLLEAMAVGVFPVVADIEANRYWLELGCRFASFHPGRASDLAGKIGDFVANRENHEVDLVANRHVVEAKGSWVENMNVLERVFRDLVERSGSRRK